MTLEGVKMRFRTGFLFPLTAKHRQKKLKDKHFTIISNNCWGGIIYESYGLQKQSPTVGLFFLADDYIKFLKNLDKFLAAEIKFINPIDSNARNYDFVKEDGRFGTYPIGKLTADGEEVEILFLHYHSEQEAKEKWEKRIKRINKNRMLVKFNDQNACKPEHIREFDTLPYKNKICFTVSDSYDDLHSVIKVKGKNKAGAVMASEEPFGASRLININNLINNLDKDNITL